jgi:NAD(P)H-hydrate epimerase
MFNMPAALEHGPLQPIDRPPAAPPRPADAHKGTFGTVIVIGGCVTMMGAPALCATAAFRGGAGLVKVAASPRVLPTVITLEPSATGILLAGVLDDDLNQLEHADPRGEAVLAVGPGMGTHDRGDGDFGDAAELVHALLAGRRTVVLDADGLNLLAASERARVGHAPLVMTPHPGEFARLAKPLGIHGDATSLADRPRLAAELARAHRAIVVLKGHRTVVTDGTQLFTNTTGNPALATAGSGDVLTGLIAALIAQGMPACAAAVLGVYLHGLAADLWAADRGPSGLTARDLTTLLPRAFQRHRT